MIYFFYLIFKISNTFFLVCNIFQNFTKFFFETSNHLQQFIHWSLFCMTRCFWDKKYFNKNGKKAYAFPICWSRFFWETNMQNCITFRSLYAGEFSSRSETVLPTAGRVGLKFIYYRIGIPVQILFKLFDNARVVKRDQHRKRNTELLERFIRVVVRVIVSQCSAVSYKLVKVMQI